MTLGKQYSETHGYSLAAATGDYRRKATYTKLIGGTSLHLTFWMVGEISRARLWRTIGTIKCQIDIDPLEDTDITEHEMALVSLALSPQVQDQQAEK